MISKEEMYEAIGELVAERLQRKIPDMSDEEIMREKYLLPDFEEAVKVKNMLSRESGFLCVSPKGNVMKLTLPYDSDMHGQEPEQLTSFWAPIWSKNPNYATPFTALKEYPYNKGDCCYFQEAAYISKMDDNVWSPADYPDGWELYVKYAEERS